MELLISAFGLLSISIGSNKEGTSPFFIPYLSTPLPRVPTHISSFRFNPNTHSVLSEILLAAFVGLLNHCNLSAQYILPFTLYHILSLRSSIMNLTIPSLRTEDTVYLLSLSFVIRSIPPPWATRIL